MKNSKFLKIISYIFNFKLKDKITALKHLKTYYYILSGIALIIGLIFPKLNYAFYFAFIYPSFKIIKNEIDDISLFFYLLPYFLVVGIGCWNYIFPYYTGIVLSVLLLDLIAKVFNLVIKSVRGELSRIFVLSSLFFVFDYTFQELPFIQKVEMPPFLSPIYNHTPILKPSAIFGSHLMLFLIIITINALVVLVFSMPPFNRKTVKGPNKFFNATIISIIGIIISSSLKS